MKHRHGGCVMSSCDKKDKRYKQAPSLIPRRQMKFSTHSAVTVVVLIRVCAELPLVKRSLSL
jgi:hypothetical protein